jgi:hypothetical protein
MRETPEADRFRARPPWFTRWGLPDPIVLWKFHGAKHDLRGLVFVTSLGYGFGLEMAAVPLWYRLQPSLERLVEFANGLESALVADGWQPMDAELFGSASESRRTSAL